MGFFLFFSVAGKARVMVHVSLDRWRLPGCAGVKHFTLT